VCRDRDELGPGGQAARARPVAYLNDVPTRLPSQLNSRTDEPLPHNRQPRAGRAATASVIRVLLLTMGRASPAVSGLENLRSWDYIVDKH
jgi:hypothetical protein